MATEHDPKHGAPGPHGSTGYEKRDANIKALFIFAVIMAAVIVITLVAMKYMFHFVSQVEPLGPPAAPYVSNARVTPPPPQLQARPHLDLKDFCADQEKQINTYAWVDKQSGIVRIPVDEAMKLVLKDGLPARPASAAPPKGAPMPVAADLYHAPAMDMKGPCGYLMEPAPPREETSGSEY
ncbi:MAG TPA: hypothetical protein VN661_11650 [Candidatus Acidoferrales bacterium]|nr:hypothetical protein [Candidatus Acidoferrales bacterium]